MGYFKKVERIVIDLNPEVKSLDPAYTAVVLFIPEGHEEGKVWGPQPERVEVRDHRHALSYANGYNSARGDCGQEYLPIVTRS